MAIKYSEDDFLPISAMQHFAFCPRQCGLIHLENLWDENRLTAEGRSMHEKAHESQTQSQPGVRIARSLRLHSFRLGLVGQADVVEFHELADASAGGVLLEDSQKRWRPFPVEYKRGRPKANHCDIIQLCAQAMCLEEMLGVTIEKGALFYGRPRRRYGAVFNDELRRETETLAAKLHEFITMGKTPQAEYGEKCNSCSLLALCMPKVTGKKKNIQRYLKSARIINEDDDK
jgi:CRISPR-associated exonuclease Cas4